jgi:hypothetical protein
MAFSCLCKDIFQKSPKQVPYVLVGR